MIPFIPVNEGQNPEAQTATIREVFRKYTYHWPLFLVSIVACLAAAYFYLKHASPVYEVTARLLIKDQIRGVSGESAMPELDFIRSNKVIDNELEILKSRALMDQVVEELQLWTTYEEIKKGFSKDVYNNTPVRLEFINGSKESITPYLLDIVVIDNEKFILKHEESEKEVKFSSRLKIGRNLFQLHPTESLESYKGSDIRISVVSPETATSIYVAKLMTSPISKLATVLEITLKDNVPQRGKAVLNRLISAYNRASVEHKNLVTASTLKFMDVRLDSLKGELIAIEKDVEQFKSSRGLTEIDAKSEFYLENVRANDAKLHDVTVQLQVIKDLENTLNTSNSEAPPSTTAITDPNLAKLIEQLTALELQRERMLATTPEENPVFEPINNQIKTVKTSIKENIRGIKASLQATRRQLELYGSDFEASIKDIPVQERQYINIKRQQTIKEELYVYLLKKREEAALSYASTLADSRIVDQAFYGMPVSPNPPLIFAAAFLLGCAIPVGLIFGRQLFNTRIINTREIKDATSVPILAELVKQRSSTPIAIRDERCRIISEQFRILRTNLQYIGSGAAKGRVTMLTSGMSGEGKSFIVSNLGAAYASYNRKTVILELDLRKPGILKQFDLTTDKGITNYLQDEVSKEEIIRKSNVHPDLFLIGTGQIPSNPSDLLGSPKLAELINWLREYFDEILIDTPPVHLVADAMIISRFSDVNLYVIRQAFTRRSELEFVKQLHDEGRLQNLNIIFNGVEMSGRYNYKLDFDYDYYLAGPGYRRLGLGERFQDVFRRF